MTNAALLTARYARRPLLLEPMAAQALVRHLALSDPRGLRSESRLEAMLRKVGLGRRQPVAMEDDDYVITPPPTQPSAYFPLWAEQNFGEPEDEGYAWSLVEGVAMMEVANALTDRGEEFCGTFYHGYDTLLASLRDAAADSRVGGVFMRWFCPGGVVAGGLAVLAKWIRENRAAAAGKPIHMFVDMGCSAAYWNIAQGDFISAPPVGLVGSIGAVIVHASYAGQLEQDGIEVTPIQFGKKKTDGAWWKTLSETALADLQAEIDQCGRDFVRDVALGRPILTPEALIATEAGVFMGHHDEPERSGHALGFVDAVETEEESFERLLSVIAGRTSVIVPKISAETGHLALQPVMETPDMLKKLGSAAPKKAETSEAEPEPAAEETSETGAEVETPEPEENDDQGAEEGDTPEVDDKTAIAGSAEAEAHPSLALAAIKNGLTLAQFKGMIPAATAPAAAPRKTSALRDSMAGIQRVGADANKPAASAGGVLVANAKSRAGK